MSNFGRSKDGKSATRRKSRVIRVDGKRIVNPLKAIRLFCVECSGGSPDTVKHCGSTLCVLWPYRFGKRPGILCQVEEYKDMFDVENFREDGKFWKEVMGE
jgi:hypothetical protein